MRRGSRLAWALAVGLAPSVAAAAPPTDAPAADAPAADAPAADASVASEDAPTPSEAPANVEIQAPSGPGFATAAPAMEPESAEPPAPIADPALAPAAEAEVETEAETEVELEEAPHPPNPKIPPTGNTQMWFRSTTFFDYFGDNYDPISNNDQFFALVNYVNLGSDTRFKRKGWHLNTLVRVDTHNVFNAKDEPLCPEGQSSCNFGADYRIERTQLRFGNKYFEVTAGDFNVNFGRGIGLSVRKIADIGVDATIKGGRVSLNTKPIDITAIGGVFNRQQTDFATRQLFTDPGYPHALCANTPALRRNDYGNPWWTMCSDIVSGGRFDTKLPGKVRVGGHYVFIWFGELVGDQHEGMHLVGGDITRKRIGKHWDLFAGVTGLLRNPHHNQNYPSLVENGIAAYLSNSLTFGDTFVLVEGKYYDNYTVAKNNAATTVQYAEAPTLERADQIIPAASNTAGARILVEHTLKKSRVTLLANYLGYAYALQNQEDMFDPNVGEMLHHGYVGMRWRTPAEAKRATTVQAFAGYRWEGFQRPPDELTAPYVRKLPHGEFYVNQEVGKTRGMSHSLSLRWEWRYEQIQKGGAPPKYFHRGVLILGYALSPFLNFAVIGGYSSEFPGLLDEPSLHPQPCDNEATCERKPHLWPGAEVRINFLESSFIRIFAGRQVGGLLCVNGSCRLLPDFEGARMDLVLSF